MHTRTELLSWTFSRAVGVLPSTRKDFPRETDRWWLALLPLLTEVKGVLNKVIDRFPPLTVRDKHLKGTHHSRKLLVKRHVYAALQFKFKPRMGLYLYHTTGFHAASQTNKKNKQQPEQLIILKQQIIPRILTIKGGVGWCWQKQPTAILTNYSSFANNCTFGDAASSLQIRNDDQALLKAARNFPFHPLYLVLHALCFVGDSSATFGYNRIVVL